MTQASLQMINPPLHVSGILFLGDVAFTPSLTFASMGCMYTALLVSLLFKIAEVIWTPKPYRLYLVWT